MADLEVVPAEDVAAVVVDDGSLMVCLLDAGEYIELGSPAGAVWAALRQCRSALRAHRSLLASGMPVAIEEVRDFARLLARLNLATVRAPNSAGLDQLSV